MAEKAEKGDTAMLEPMRKVKKKVMVNMFYFLCLLFDEKLWTDIHQMSLTVTQPYHNDITVTIQTMMQTIVMEIIIWPGYCS